MHRLAVRLTLPVAHLPESTRTHELLQLRYRQNAALVSIFEVIAMPDSSQPTPGPNIPVTYPPAPDPQRRGEPTPARPLPGTPERK